MRLPFPLSARTDVVLDDIFGVSIVHSEHVVSKVLGMFNPVCTLMVMTISILTIFLVSFAIKIYSKSRLDSCLSASKILSLLSFPFTKSCQIPRSTPLQTQLVVVDYLNFLSQNFL